MLNHGFKNPLSLYSSSISNLLGEQLEGIVTEGGHLDIL